MIMVEQAIVMTQLTYTVQISLLHFQSSAETEERNRKDDGARCDQDVGCILQEGGLICESEQVKSQK